MRWLRKTLKFVGSRVHSQLRADMAHAFAGDVGQAEMWLRGRRPADVRLSRSFPNPADVCDTFAGNGAERLYRTDLESMRRGSAAHAASRAKVLLGTSGRNGMSSYLVINLADRNGFGPISSLHSGVTAKRTNRGLSKLFKGIDTTNLVNAFDLLDKDLLSQLNRNDPELTDLRSKCDAAKKIYLATHDLPTDVDHAFANAAGGNPLSPPSSWQNFCC